MGRRSGPTLTRDDILDAAGRVLLAEGAAAVGTAAVARKLGVRAPSLYWHFAGNDALRLALAIRGWDGLVASLPPPCADAAGTLRGFALAYRGWAIANAPMYRLMTSTPFDPTDSALLGLTARVAGSLTGLALPPGELIHAVRGLRSTVHGFVDLELAGQLALAIPPDESFDWLIDVVVRGAVRRDTIS